jgi:hypothetical protein
MMASGVVWLIGNLPESRRGGAKSGKDGGFDVFEDCRVISDQGNDGDSFQVKMSDDKVRHLRFYFVDAPETGVTRYRDGKAHVKGLLSEVKSLTDYTRGGRSTIVGGSMSSSS